jgi:hypothetical protein
MKKTKTKQKQKNKNNIKIQTKRLGMVTVGCDSFCVCTKKITVNTHVNLI